MKPGDLVKLIFDSKRKYYLVKGWNTTIRPVRKYYILIDTKTGDIITEYEYNLKLVHASQIQK